MTRLGSSILIALIPLIAGALAITLLTGCGASASPPEAPPAATSTPDNPGRPITLGNIYPGSPTRKIQEFLPLAQYLADSLRDLGIAEGKVVIAQDQEQMARFLQDGTVDIYFDATIPSMEVCEAIECQFILQQWKGGEPTQYGIFVAHKGSGINSIEDLEGKVIALEKSHSTVGFILPTIAIVQNGFSLVQVDSPREPIPPKSIGYFNAGGGKNAMDMLLRDEIAAAALGERAYNQFSPDIKEQTATFYRTMEVPSQLVSIRPGLDNELVDRISEALTSLEHAEDGPAILERLRDTRRFDTLQPETKTMLSDLRGLLKLAPKE